MAVLPNQDQTEVPVMVGRRSTRLSVAVPILVSGTDSAGEAFREHTFTLNVNKHGAEIATSRLLAPGAEISIENVSLGRKALARVVSRRERRTPNSPYEVSVELLDPENIWGVKFPPSDWDKASPSKNSKSIFAKPVAAETDSPPDAPVKAVPEATPAETETIALTFTPIENMPEVPAASEAAEAGPSPPAAQVLKKPASEEREAAAGEPPLNATSAPQANAEPAVAAAPPEAEPLRAPFDTSAMDEKVASARAAADRLKDLLNNLETASARLERLLAQANEAREHFAAEMEGARGEARESGRQTAQSTLEEFSARLRSEFEASSKQLLDETGRRLQEEVSAAVAAFGRQAGAHLSKLTLESGPELEAKQKSAVTLAKDQIAAVAEAAALELEGRLKNSADGIARAAEAEIKASFEKSAGSAAEFDAKLKKSAEETARVLESQIKASLETASAKQANLFAETLRARMESVLDGAGSPIEKARQKMQEESAAAQAQFREVCQSEAEQVSGQILSQLDQRSESARKTADEANAALWESSKSIKYDLTFKAEKLRKQLGDLAGAAEEGFRNYTEVQLSSVREEIQENCRTITAKSSREFSEQLQKTADAILESNSPELQRQAEDAAVMCKGMLEAATRELLEETRGRLATLALESTKAFSSEARSATEEFTRQLQGALQDSLKQSASKVETALRMAGEAEQRAVLARIEAEGRKAGEEVIAEILSRTEGAAQKATDTVYKQIGIATVVLKDWGDQAALRLEAQFKNSMEAFERRVQEISSAALAAHHAHTEEAAREVGHRLEQAARILSADANVPAPNGPSFGEPKP